MKVSAQYAAEHFDDLALAVDNGESVEIARPDKPALHLVRTVVSEATNLGPRVLGAGRGELRVPSEEEWAEMDKEWRKSFEEKFSPEA